jgi:hypothetical protein
MHAMRTRSCNTLLVVEELHGFIRAESRRVGANSDKS